MKLVRSLRQSIHKVKYRRISPSNMVKNLSKKSKRVTPVDFKVPIPEKDDFTSDHDLKIVRQLQLLLGIQALIGINRLYLLEKWKFLIWIAYFVTTVLVLTALYYIVTNDFYGGSSRLHKDATCVEFIMLALYSTFLKRKYIRNLFTNLEAFDKRLNVSEIPLLTSSVRKDMLVLMFRVTYNCLEYCIWALVTNGNANSAMPMVYISSIAHDSEQIYYCAMLKIILNRVKLLKAHVTKRFHSGNKDFTENEENVTVLIDKLTRNADLDTTAIHRAYEQLHKCAEQLNSIMSYPMIVMFLSSGLSTIVLLKYILQWMQYDGHDVDETIAKTVKAHIVYASIRCIRYTVLVIIPCYYSSITARQITGIRTTLHDAMTNLHFDKMERRKVKALCQMIHENDFAYALWGVIRLNMSLPLTYFGICTTYLVIIIQFSKFIDQKTIYEMVN